MLGEAGVTCRRVGLQGTHKCVNSLGQLPGPGDANAGSAGKARCSGRVRREGRTRCWVLGKLSGKFRQNVNTNTGFASVTPEASCFLTRSEMLLRCFDVSKQKQSTLLCKRKSGMCFSECGVDFGARRTSAAVSTRRALGFEREKGRKERKARSPRQVLTFSLSRMV